MPRFAANLGHLFTERPLLERFAAAAAAGFSAVELQFPYDTPASAVRAELERHRLSNLGINTAPGNAGESGLAAVAGREQDFWARFEQALDYVTAIRGTAIHCMAGTVTPDRRPAAESLFVANLTRAADAAAKQNITLLIEPLNHRDRPDYFLSRVEQAADVIAKVGRPNVKIQFDCYHVQIMQGDLIKRFERHLPVIGHVQIAAVPSRGEPDRGEVNYPEVLAAFDALGYRGHVGAEYKPTGRSEDSFGWMRAYGVAPRAA